MGIVWVPQLKISILKLVRKHLENGGRKFLKASMTKIATKS